MHKRAGEIHRLSRLTMQIPEPHERLVLYYGLYEKRAEEILLCGLDLDSVERSRARKYFL